MTVRHNVSSAKKQRDVPYYFLVYGKLSKNSFRATGKTGRLTPKMGESECKGNTIFRNSKLFTDFFFGKIKKIMKARNNDSEKRK